MYAKIKGTELKKYPYLFMDLYNDNPYTSFDDRYTIKEWFDMTEEATIHGCELVDVILEKEPEVEEGMRAESYKEPILENGQWILKWNIIPISIIDPSHLCGGDDGCPV